MPISRMNDSANQTNVKDYLQLTAKEKVRKLYENSPLVRQTCFNFRQLRASQFNTSPLDILQLGY